METTQQKKMTSGQLRREKLRELSKIARMIRESEDLGCTINEILIERFYTDETHEEFHSMRDWNELGYKVKKGSKAFTIWGKKRSLNSKQEASEQQKEDDEESEDKFYPLAFIFSNAQVEQR